MATTVINYVLNIYFRYSRAYSTEINIFLRDAYVIILCLNMDEIEKVSMFYWLLLSFELLYPYIYCIQCRYVKTRAYRIR